MNFKSLLEGFSFNTERIEYKNSFWPRTIREWNKLPPAVLDINNTELIKTKLTM